MEVSQSKPYEYISGYKIILIWKGEKEEKQKL
jgi:hypothetical protein